MTPADMTPADSTSPSPAGSPRVVEIDAPAAHDLRYRVLRVGTPSSVVDFAEDRLDTTFHLGVVIDDRIVAISTWIDRPSPDAPGVSGVQLRGMATDPAAEFRGRGYGSLVLRAGIERAASAGVEVVWANARDSALAFYEAHGFHVSSEPFITDDTQLPHHRILRRLV